MRARQHVNPLGLGFETFNGVVPILPDDAIVECEVGCADAQFLFERARLEPTRRYVGVEIRDHLVDEVNAKAAAAGLPLEAVFCNANHHLDKVFEPERVQVVYLNFPDPWFKRRHQKRRMIDEVLAGHIKTILAQGGQLFVQTDVWSIAIDALEVFENCDEWLVNEAGPWSFWKDGNPFGARSWRERNAEETGLAIWRLLYSKRAQTRP